MTTPDVGADRPRRWEYPALVALGVAVVLVLGLTIFDEQVDFGECGQRAGRRTGRAGTGISRRMGCGADILTIHRGWRSSSTMLHAPGVLSRRKFDESCSGSARFLRLGVRVLAAADSGATNRCTGRGNRKSGMRKFCFRYALDGVDALPTRKAVSMTLAKRGDPVVGSCRTGRSSGLDGLPERQANPGTAPGTSARWPSPKTPRAMHS